MYANLKLGFRDIWKHKFSFLACIAFLLIFNMIVIMSTMTIYIDQISKSLIESKQVETFDLIYTQYEDFSYKREDILNLARINSQDAFTYWFSSSLSNYYARPIYLIFGDGSLIHPGIINQEEIAVYAFDTSNISHIDILDVNYSIQQIPYSERVLYDWTDDFQNSNNIFVVYQGNAMIETIDNMAERNPDIFYYLVGSTWIRADDGDRIDEYKDYVMKQVDGLSLRGDFYRVETFEPDRFLTSYLLPLVVFLALTGVLSFLLIFQGMLQGMKRDLTIHIQSGAKFRDVLLRFYVFFGSIIVLSFVLLYCLGFIAFFTKPGVYTSYCIIAISISVYIARALKRTNLFDNLRGDIL